ncbi:Muscle M-line assembly protein unc-89 [Echinococcus granulosus]|uniref:Muscle M-line assembly protein unc-89 n=1 Tax=Echinococcus granulosus TaxID=6210 RepID=W6UL14_ECHGR|nr:Muscle M-line assembly protein unc-89 [Echinococcus granulosus]EUB61841.1 Muscle M-line assembly protein unc-89 [Echinococcus granulosus]
MSNSGLAGQKACPPKPATAYAAVHTTRNVHVRACGRVGSRMARSDLYTAFQRPPSPLTLSGVNATEADKVELQNFYRSQIQLNLERLHHLEGQLNSLQSTRQIWLSWVEKWNDFRNSARQLDEAMTSSRTRIVQAPRPQSVPAVEAALAEHTRDGDYVNQLIAEVNAKANTLASLVGAEPTATDGPSRVRRYVEVPYTTPGPSDAELAKSVRSELCIATAGLEIRSKDWERVFNAHKHTLEERAKQLSRMTEMDKVERDLRDAESEFQRISITVNLDSPITQIERADENLRVLELRIPDLQSRVKSTAYLPSMQFIRGPSDLLEISGVDVPMLEERQRQLETRVSNLVTGTAKCRTEVNLTLQLLRAVRDAENCLSCLTMDLGRSSDRLKSLAPDDQVQMRQIVADIETQRDRAQKYADQHVPQLQTLVAQFPDDRARIKVQPIIRRFQDSTEALSKLVQDVRVRSERLVDLTRLQGPVVEAVESVASHQMHLPRPKPPTILRPLSNIHVVEGTRVALTTNFDAGIPQGYPETVDIEGTWHRDGLPVTTPDYRTRMDQHSASLTIEEVFGDDSGVFTFRLKTPFGEVETSGSLMVSETHKSISSADEEMITPTKRRKPQQAPSTFPPFEEETGEAPRFTRPLRSMEVGEDEPVMLECQATGNPVPTIAWFKDGISIDNSPEYVVFEVNGSCAIKIRKTNASIHDGNYTCRARNDHGEAITTCQLHVRPIEPPRIVYPLSDKQVPEGQSLELKLTFKGTPPVRAEWYVNGVPLESTQSSAIPNIFGDKAILKLPATYQQDVAQYTCLLRNPAGEAKSSCQVDLRSRRVERPLNIEDLVDAASVQPARRPLPQSPLQDGKQSPIASSPRLTTAPARPESFDQGKVSPRSVYSPVSVEARPPWRATSVPPQFSSIYGTEHRRDLLAPKRTFSPGQLPPHFTQPLHNAAATEGQMVRLQCRVLGRPKPQIDWYKDGVSLTSAPNYTVRSEGDRHCIEFSDIYLTDHGEYTCVATNPAGVAKTSCRMDVEPLSSGDESADRPPQIVKSLPRYLTINEGEGVTLECSFVGRPEPSITWYKDTVPLQASPNVEISQVGSTAVLSMTDSSIQDAGVYRAVASNRVGVCQSEIHVNILPADKGPRPMDASPFHEGPPRFTKPLRDIYMETRSPRLSRLDCFVLGIPRPTVEWRHANHRIGPEDRRYHITADRPPGVHTLTIVQPSQDTAGHYEVLAENIHGSATCSATVHLPRKWSLSSLSPHSPVVYTTLPRQTSPWRQISPADSVHVIPTYATATTRRFLREVSEPPELRRYTSTTQLHVNERHTTPPVQFTFRLPPERAMSKVEVLRPIESVPSPRLQIRHASSLTVLNKMRVCPTVPLQETTVQHHVASHPRLSPGYVSTEDLMRPIEVVPMVPVYETRQVLEPLQLKPLRRTVSQDRFKVLVEAPISARPVLESNMATEVVHHKTIQVTPIVPIYRTQREASVASQPALEPGYTSEGEFEHNISVVPMIPSFKTETERSLPARPSLETGFESKTSLERQMEVQRELKELRYKTQMERPVPAQPQLFPGYATTMDVEHSMDVVPLVQKPEERFQTSYSTDVSVQYVPIDLVVELPTPPKFVKHLNNVVAEEGSQVILEGVVSGKPTPAISWFRKSTPLTDSPDFRLEYCPDGTVRLTLREICEEDIGPYRCEASNIAGTAESYAYLTITAKAVAPRFIKPLENTTVLSGNVIRLTVKVDGHPKPDVKWTVNGREITSSPDFVIEEVADGVQSLTIPHALKTDTGRYSVIAKNEAGEAITSGIVTVLGSWPPSTMPSPKLAGDEMTRTEVTVPLASPTPGPTIAPTPEAPKFAKILPQCRVVEEETPIVLTVEAKANSMPFLHWYRNGIPLETGPNYKISQFGPYLENVNAIQPEPVRMVGELEVLRAAPTDAGSIVCVAENPYGRAETTMTLDVIPKPESLQPVVQPPRQANPQKPWFTIPLQPDLTLQAGSPLTLTAEAMGNPLPFLHWYRDGQQLDSTPEHDITQVGPELAKPGDLLDSPVSMTGRLVINELFPTDSGTYQCVAENSAGQAETFVTLNVFTPPVKKQGQRPQFVKRLTPTVQCRVGETVVLETEISGQPPPRVSWYRSGIEIYPDFKYRMEESPNTGIYRLVIQSIEQEDICEYTVRASNEYGSVESITRLTLIQEYTEVTRIDLPGTLAPVTMGVPYAPTERTQLDVQVEGAFSPVVMAVEVTKPLQHLSELEMELKKSPMEFQPIIVEFPHPDRSGQPAVFIRRLPDSLTLDENVPARITAQMSGIPLPSVSWLKDGQPLVSSNRVFTSVEPNNTLVFHFAQPRPIDAGTYTAIVTNPLGHDSSSVQVNLGALPEPKHDEPILELMGVPPSFTKAPFPLLSLAEGQADVIQSPGIFSSLEGTPLRFEVQVHGVPEPNVSWFLNEHPVHSDFKHKILTLPDSVHCLTLEAPTSLTDGGTYRCVASNPLGVKELVFPVTIEPKPQQVTVPPRFLKKPASKIVTVPGQPLLLEAAFEGVPAPVISWHKDGRLISPTEVSSGRIQVLVTENSTQLSVAEIKPEDVGTWQCLASSTAGLATCRTKLDLEVPKPVTEEPQKMLFIPKKRTSVSGPSDSPYPEIRQAPKSLDVVEGNSARFSTMVVGTPRPLVCWYINGVLVQPTVPLEISSEEPRESSHFDGLLHHLELRNCRPEDSGVVTVEALRADVSEGAARTEPNAVVTASANLRVLPAPGKIPLLRPVQKIPTQQTKPSQPPVIIQGPKNAEVQEGSPITFACQVAGSPMPEVTWIYNGQTAIQPSANFHPIVTPDGKASLRIDHVRPENAGEYKIRVTNQEGSVEKSARLDIISDEKAPDFTTPFPEEILKLPEGTSLTLDVEAVGKPTPQLVWKRDSTPFAPTPEIQITQLTSTHHRLEILELFQTDSSEFSVEAFNKLGKAVTKTKLIVLPAVKEQPPVFLTCPPEQLTAFETATAQ